MSVCFVVVPAAVAASWPILSAVISAAATAAGFRALKTASSKETAAEASKATTESVELELAAARVKDLDAMDSMTMTDGSVVATFYQDELGQCKLHVEGNKSQQELIETGRTLLQRVRQQLAYHRVVEEMKQRGYTIVEEQVAADQSIRLKVRSW